MEKILLLFVGLFAVLAFVSGIIILFNHDFGKRFFEDWNTVKLNAVRVVVASSALAISTLVLQSNLMLIAGCILTFAAILFFAMGRWEKGRNFVQAFLVESHSGQRIYVSYVILPMAVLLFVAAFF